MKVFVVLAVFVASAMAEAPLFRPSGRLLLLPARLENPPLAETNATQVPAQDAEMKEEAKSEQLLGSGEYYILLADGRLQMVKYSTAALKEDTPAPAPQHVKEVEPVPAPFAQFQVEYLQFPQQSQDLSQSRQDTKDSQDTQEQGSGFQARVQYREVKPISAPIYAYKPAPLVRVLRR